MAAPECPVAESPVPTALAAPPAAVSSGREYPVAAAQPGALAAVPPAADEYRQDAVQLVHRVLSPGWVAEPRGAAEPAFREQPKLPAELPEQLVRRARSHVSAVARADPPGWAGAAVHLPAPGRPSPLKKQEHQDGKPDSARRVAERPEAGVGVVRLERAHQLAEEEAAALVWIRFDWLHQERVHAPAARQAAGESHLRWRRAADEAADAQREQPDVPVQLVPREWASALLRAFAPPYLEPLPVSEAAGSLPVRMELYLEEFRSSAGAYEPPDEASRG
jgi:hypothetical protein